ncbi:hypothetical protein DYH10_01910 [Candidatus Saccharibacteria bacterium CPR2]|nr:hypothetical protein [Candidatus Saccharibacteria bacterium CPR2]
MNALLSKLEKKYSSIGFKSGKSFMWSPSERTVYYSKTALNSSSGAWSLLHEIGHATLNHSDFNRDIELLKLEMEAWQKARKIGKELNVEIDDDHIQSCLDSYRDWLKRRSTCPECGFTNPCSARFTYSCLNCNCAWEVSSSQLCKKQKIKG